MCFILTQSHSSGSSWCCLWLSPTCASPVLERIERYKSLGKQFIRSAIGLLYQRSRLRVKRKLRFVACGQSLHIIYNNEVWFDASEETFESRKREIAQRTRSLRGTALMGTPTYHAPPARAPRNDYASLTALEINEIQVTMRTMTLRSASFRENRTNSYPPTRALRIYDGSETASESRERALSVCTPTRRVPQARAPKYSDASGRAFEIREEELTQRTMILRGAEFRGAQTTGNPVARAPRIGDRVRFHLQGAETKEGTVAGFTDEFLRIEVPGWPKSFLRKPHKVTLL
jgi:hypothetical protein